MSTIPAKVKAALRVEGTDVDGATDFRMRPAGGGTLLCMPGAFRCESSKPKPILPSGTAFIKHGCERIVLPGLSGISYDPSLTLCLLGPLLQHNCGAPI